MPLRRETEFSSWVAHVVPNHLALIVSFLFDYLRLSETELLIGTFFVSKKDGSDITEDQVRSFLRPMEGIEQVWKPSAFEVDMLGNGVPTNGLLAKATLYMARKQLAVSLSIRN